MSVTVQHAVKGKADTMFVPGLQLENLPGATGGQIQVDPRVVVIGYAQVHPHDRRNGVEQADQVEADIHHRINVGPQD
ncbi:hypothetical protein D3C80_1995350 [compost metagenome]